MELEDKSGKCRLTLWRDHADSNVAVGSYVRATELVVQTYKDEKSLYTTYKTKDVSNNTVILLRHSVEKTVHCNILTILKDIRFMYHYVPIRNERFHFDLSRRWRTIQYTPLTSLWIVGRRLWKRLLLRWSQSTSG